MGYGTMASMMGKNSATAGVPTQTFGAQNILGTPVPQVGDNKGLPNYKSRVGQGFTNTHNVIVVVAFVGIGYLLWHLNFEK
jgi:hypothetical protein